MSLKEYREYFMDNPKGYWFKAKLYGWGWTPVTWQGFIIIAVFVVFLVRISVTLPAEATQTELIKFFAEIIFSITILLAICYKTGEKPHWQWGPPKKDTEHFK